MTIGQALHLGQRLINTTSDSPALDAEVLLAHALDCERSSVLTQTNQPLPWLKALAYLRLMLVRRCGEPVAYLTQQREFYGRRFRVNRSVLVPRPDTELLIDVVLGLVRINNATIKTIVDVGTGSGCIAITLAHELPTEIKLYATDSSPAALRVAYQNASEHGVVARLTFFKGNLIAPLVERQLLSPASLLVANLPYLRPHEITGGLKREPRAALIGGSDGLSCYRELINELAALPTTQCPGWLVLELHPPTADKVVALARQAFPNSQITVTPDLAKLPRVLTARLT